MGTTWNAAGRELPQDLHLVLPGLELHAMGTACLHQTSRVFQSLVNAGIAHERHVAQDQRALYATRYATAVIHHVGNAHRHRCLLALYHHAKRVPDQNHVDPGSIQNPRKRGIVSGQAGDPRAAFGFHFSQRVKCDSCKLRARIHGFAGFRSRSLANGLSQVTAPRSR